MHGGVYEMRHQVKQRGYFEDNEFIRGVPVTAVINEPVMQRVDYVVEDTLLHDETFKYSEEELADLSEEYRIAMNMDKKQLATFVVAALDKYPFMVMQCVAELVIERGKRDEH